MSWCRCLSFSRCACVIILCSRHVHTFCRSAPLLMVGGKWVRNRSKKFWYACIKLFSFMCRSWWKTEIRLFFMQTPYLSGTWSFFFRKLCENKPSLTLCLGAHIGRVWLLPHCKICGKIMTKIHCHVLEARQCHPKGRASLILRKKNACVIYRLYSINLM